MRVLMLPVLIAIAAPAGAQADDDGARRTRVGIGASIGPRYPGADGGAAQPYFDLSRRRGDTPFEFEAPDESAGLSLYEDDRLAIGPALGLQASRRSRDTNGQLDRVGFTVEPGAFVHYYVTPGLRVRGEVRQGIGGHRGLTGIASIDYVMRDGDRWLWSAGPRVTFANARYNRAYFGISTREAAASGLPAYAPGGGVMAVGALASGQYALTPRWGVFGFAKYDRLTGDAADSPVVATFGSRDQWTGGLGVSHTFGRGVR